MLIVADQFEEMFTLPGEETVPFQEALLQLMHTVNTYVILTVRADFYPELMTSSFWTDIKAHRHFEKPSDRRKRKAKAARRRLHKKSSSRRDQTGPHRPSAR